MGSSWKRMWDMHRPTLLQYNRTSTALMQTKLQLICIMPADINCNFSLTRAKSNFRSIMNIRWCKINVVLFSPATLMHKRRQVVSWKLSWLQRTPYTCLRNVVKFLFMPANKRQWPLYTKHLIAVVLNQTDHLELNETKQKTFGTAFR